MFSLNISNTCSDKDKIFAIAVNLLSFLFNKKTTNWQLSRKFRLYRNNELKCLKETDFRSDWPFLVLSNSLERKVHLPQKILKSKSSLWICMVLGTLLESFSEIILSENTCCFLTSLIFQTWPGSMSYYYTVLHTLQHLINGLSEINILCIT